MNIRAIKAKIESCPPTQQRVGRYLLRHGAEIPYQEVPRETVTLPERMSDPNYERSALRRELYVPKKY